MHNINVELWPFMSITGCKSVENNHQHKKNVFEGITKYINQDTLFLLVNVHRDSF